MLFWKRQSVSKQITEQRRKITFSKTIMPIFEENFCILADEKVIVAIPFEARLYLKGKVSIDSILCNDVSVFGGKFSPKSEFPIQVFSPRGYSLIYLESIQSGAKGNTDKKEYDKEDKKKIKKFVANYGATSTVILFSKLDIPWTESMEFLLKFSDSKKQKMALFGKEKWKKDYVIVPENVEETLDVSFIVEKEFDDIKFRLLEINEQWSYAVQSCLYVTENLHEKPRYVKKMSRAHEWKNMISRFFTDWSELAEKVLENQQC